MPFYQVLTVTDEPLLFRKVMSAVMERLLRDAQPQPDGSPSKLPNVNVKEVAQDIFAIASNEYVVVAGWFCVGAVV